MPQKIRLEKNPPAGWRPQEIVYSRLTFRMGPDGEPVFEADPLGCVVDRTDVRKFVAEMARGATPVCARKYERDPEDPHTGPIGPLDIHVAKRCYVVLHLVGEGWQFASDAAAVTAKSEYDDDNVALTHVDENGDVMQGDVPGRDGCRIAYFSVVYRRRWEHQYFNYHVQFRGGDGSWRDFDIDPDIPNGGGRLPLGGKRGARAPRTKAGTGERAG